MNHSARFLCITLVILLLSLTSGCTEESVSSSTSISASDSAGAAVTTNMLYQHSLSLSGVISDGTSTAGAKPSARKARTHSIYQELASLLAKARDVSVQPAFAPITANCATSGTNSLNITLNPFVATITASSCNNGVTTISGTMTISGTNTNTSSSLTVLLGDGDTAVETTDYTVTENATSKTTIMSISATVAKNKTTGVSTLTLNGVIKETTTTTIAEVTANNLNMVVTSQSTTEQVVLNGDMIFADNSTNGDNFSASFNNFSSMVYNADSSYELSGTVTLTSTSKPCLDGSYTLATLTPIANGSNGEPTSGKLTINGNTLEYLSNGSVQVADSTGSHIYSPTEISGDICNTP